MAEHRMIEDQKTDEDLSLLGGTASGNATVERHAEVLIYGASDDIVCITGNGLNDELYPKLERDEADYIGVSDGTLLKVVYDGCWRFTRIAAGSAEFIKTEATGDDGPDHANGAPGYSDVVTLRGDIKWALMGLALARASRRR